MNFKRFKPFIKLSFLVDSPQVTSVKLCQQTRPRDVDTIVLLLLGVIMIISALITLRIVVPARGHLVVLLHLLHLGFEVLASNLLLSIRQQIGLQRSQESCHRIQLLIVGTLWVVDVAANYNN